MESGSQISFLFPLRHAAQSVPTPAQLLFVCPLCVSEELSKMGHITKNNERGCVCKPARYKPPSLDFYPSFCPVILSQKDSSLLVSYQEKVVFDRIFIFRFFLITGGVIHFSLKTCYDLYTKIIKCNHSSTLHLKILNLSK